MRKITKRSAVIAAVAVVGIGGGAAWAATNGWDITGTGTGDASAATITPLTATADLGQTNVYPGLTTTTVTKIDNPNDFPVKLNGGNVTPTGVAVTNVSTAAACQSALIAAPSTLTASLPAGTLIGKKSAGYGVTSSVTISTSFPQSCAGSHIKVTYSFTAVSTA
jgi:hypothetical protein